ncbi:MAG: hypothetical protein LBE10_11515 [Treponema sp.]|jgi:hypothetical protein|nr:hypothetical protein [Treponema sp.]
MKSRTVLFAAVALLVSGCSGFMGDTGKDSAVFNDASVKNIVNFVPKGKMDVDALIKDETADGKNNDGKIVKSIIKFNLGEVRQIDDSSKDSDLKKRLSAVKNALK